MAIGRLVAFGCSLTYGDGLPDCYVSDPTDPLGYHAGPVPSRHAWPRLAADMLGMDCLNLAGSGNSNTRILLGVLTHAWQPGDAAAVLWTYPDRDYLLLEGGPRNVGPWNATSWDTATSYYTAHDGCDMQTRAWISHHHAASYLSSIGIPFTMASASPWERGWWTGDDHRAIDASVFSQPFMDVGLDGLHGGMLQHEAWAREFADRMSANAGRVGDL
jgi:hypothetical protein